jgi:hypothetical protein
VPYRKDHDEWTITTSPIVEIDLGHTRVLHIERLNDLLRLTSARRVPRAYNDALNIGGTVLLPIDKLGEVIDVVRTVAKDPPKDRGTKTRRGRPKTRRSPRQGTR